MDAAGLEQTTNFVTEPEVWTAHVLDQALRRFLPLRRRRFITARPAGVLMRFRKPCLFLRFRFEG